MSPGKNGSGACKSCVNANTKEMVQCDRCNDWHHFGCVGVDASVAERDWKCPKCEAANAMVLEGLDSAGGGVLGARTPENQRGMGFDEEESVQSASSFKSMKSQSRSVKLKLERLEEQRQIEIQYLSKKYELLALEDSSEDEEQQQPVKTRLSPVVPAKIKQARALTDGQLSARQVLAKDLPTFSGKPEEWAVFISNYENSTELCGFTDAENLVRLQKAIKGKALEAIGFTLLLPEMVSEAISTLRMLYGRPETIIKSLIRKIRADPLPKADKFETIVAYAIAVRQLYYTMKAAGLRSHIDNPLLLEELVERLPPNLRLKWALEANKYPKCTLEEYSIWLNVMGEAASALTPLPALEGRSGGRFSHVQVHQEGDKTQQSSRTTSTSGKCFVCQFNHRLVDCQVFNDFPVSKRLEVVRKNWICECCLRHSSRKMCREKKNCGVDGCGCKRHKLLHEVTHTLTSAGGYNAHQHEGNEVLFRMAPITIHANGKTVNTLAFLDSGSSLTLMDKEVACALELKGKKMPLCLKWTADVVRMEEDSEIVTVEVSAQQQESRDKAKHFILQDVRTVQNLSLPKQSFDASSMQAKYNHLRGLPLVSYSSVQPKLLIGLQNEYLAVSSKVREGTLEEPIAMKTRLGWLVSGGCGSGSFHMHHCEECHCEKELHEEVRNFFALESYGVGKSFVETSEDKRASGILKNTTKRIGNAYESGLLWRYDDFMMPDSYPMALKRLQCIERKMHIDLVLRDDLNRQVENLLTKGYARKLSRAEAMRTTLRTWYMPTFIVRNPNKQGKVRLVWDGAAKTQGVSLNSMLLKGPDQLMLLPAVLYAFRSHQVAISGDISEMFHRVRVRNEDQQAQRFLWRSAESERHPEIYVMEVLTFGASCSPSIAQYVKNLNAQRFVDKYPRAVVAITKNHYVDDLMDSVDTDEEAIKLATDVAYIHAQGGFQIRGWQSNSRNVLKALGEQSQGDKQIEAVSSIEQATTKVLGIWWRTDPDIFTFAVRFPKINEELLRGQRAPTKRELLRVLMSIFDPLGFLAHYLVHLKVLLQEVWRSGVDWDETIPQRLHHQWGEWLRLLPQVEDVQIPRCYSPLTADSDASVQLHVFVDASENAMAAVAYLRISAGSLVNCALVGAKTKVAPRIPMSIPRMELQAATIGVRLAESIVRSHSLKFHSKVFWSDSRTVLSWLTVDPKRYNQFVMYRIGEVLEKSKLAEWRWVPTKENVADDATKWKKMPTFQRTDRWFRGPSFMWEAEDKWPDKKHQPMGEEKEELRPRFVLAHAVVREPLIDTARFTKWMRLLRTLAWVRRFIENLKRKLGKELPMVQRLTTEELEASQLTLVRMAQEEVYGDEMAILKKGGRLQKSSRLLECTPYVDDDGLLRMKGRIDKADCVEYCTKRPLLMPRHHHFTSLLVAYYHNLFHHCCHETVVNEVRQRFWIPGLRTVLRTVRRACLHCQHKNAKPTYPQMAPLPAARLAAYTKPFTHVGVDYFGPMVVTVGRRSEKRWGVLFTCLTIRAVHLELARGLSTDDCIICIRNFVGRRGTPAVFYSDNGTNFKGAERELEEALQSLDKDTIHDTFTTPYTKWVYNPPSSPHMGGSWERLVGSVKKVLKEVTRNQRLQDDSLNSMLIEVESIINSRPLTHVSVEANDAEALTPNHFLLGSSSGCKASGKFCNEDLMLRKSWRKSQQLANIFWKRWVHEYLPTLTRRSKWFEQTKPIEEGAVVIIVDENLPRGCWPKGIVVGVTKAADGQVRSAAVKTAHGIYTRPVVKLAVLNVDGPDESETITQDSRLTGGENVKDRR